MEWTATFKEVGAMEWAATLGTMTVVQLKAELLRCKLSRKGKKETLIKRLAAYRTDPYEVGEVVPLPAGLEFTTVAELNDTSKTLDTRELSMPDQKDIRDESQAIVEVARSIVIGDDSEYRGAGLFLTSSVKTLLKKIDDTFNPMISSWHEGHKQALATKKRLAEPLLEAERVTKLAMSKYNQELKRLKELEREELEQAMLEAAETCIVEEAAELLEKGDEEGAERILKEWEEGSVEQQVVVPIPLVVAPPVAEGTSIRVLKRFRVIHESKINRKYLIPDLQQIQKMVNVLGKEAEEIVGGIEYYEEDSVSARAI